MSVLEKIEWVYPPRHGPEWGSGGIFGLRYHRGVLYYTLAFEAKAWFVSSSDVYVYEFEQVGKLPTSGGDTYNAVDAVDDELFFGGWVHAPAWYMGRGEGRRATVSFADKYSHVHRYIISEQRVELLWKESIHDHKLWAGEVSEIIYDPVGDRLLLARGDGHMNLGVYQLGRRGGRASPVTRRPALKGTLFYDHACFDVTDDPLQGVSGVQCVDLVEERAFTLEFNDTAGMSVDGSPAFHPVAGAATHSHGRFFLFVRGGVFVGNPLDASLERLVFIRLFDFGESLYAPRRTMAKPVAGGVLVAFNAYSEALLHPSNELEERISRATNTIVGPSVLLYVAPPTARIVAVFGARITGFEVVDGKLLVATNNNANTSRHDALPLDAGHRGFTLLGMDTVNAQPPPVLFTVRGWQVGARVFGGVPLYGYREPRLTIRSTKQNRLTVYTYSIDLPPVEPEVDKYAISEGRNTLDLKPHKPGIVAFKLEREDHGAIIRIGLD